MRVVKVSETRTYVDIRGEDLISSLKYVRVIKPNGNIVWSSYFGDEYGKEDSEKLETAYQQYLSGLIKTELNEALSKE